MRTIPAEVVVLVNYERCADAAYAANIPPGFAIVGGYYGGPNAYHVWSDADWALFPGWRLPIWVGGNDGPAEGSLAVNELLRLRVPSGAITVLDMETRHDSEYVRNFGRVLTGAGFRTWVYGSASSVFRNPPLNGYWVADYTTDMSVIDRMLQQPHVRACQYDPAGPYDASLVKQWTEGEMWKGSGE